MEAEGSLKFCNSAMLTHSEANEGIALIKQCRKILFVLKFSV